LNRKWSKNSKIGIDGSPSFSEAFFCDNSSLLPQASSAGEAAASDGR
jgi:hypothetical protein